MSISKYIPQLDDLYKRYGYEVKKTLTTSNYRVYTLSKGVYFGADVVELNMNEPEITELFKKLSETGYGCRHRKFLNIKDAEEALFASFFHSDTLKERLQNKYLGFTASQSQLLKVAYQYISVSYFIDDSSQISKKNIVENVIAKIDTPGPQLIIIEAAAGYGKTCTSFEVINYLSKYRKDKSPIFTELSKDRKWSKFKYILQDVILNEFHSLLNEELVIHEVQTGRIPLVIDGFDELLSKEQDKAGKDEFEQVETMLYTIGELLKSEAKIILTGRKTAIFSGDSFKQWVDESTNQFNVSRFLINPPRIEDWLSDEKLDILYKSKIPIRDISNPVLLAFLRSLNLDNFIEVTKNPDQIVDRYFETILNREQTRQELRLEPKVQIQVFRKLAKRMMEFDITADTKSWIKDLIEEQNRSVLELVRKSYPLAERPTTEELTNTLSNHALLDRKGNDDKVGFINDFIFGTFIADSILEMPEEDLGDISNHMFELGITSFQFQTEEKKKLLWDKINKLKKFSSQERLIFEYILIGTINTEFKDSSFNDLTISNLSFNSPNQFVSCVFANCCFKQTDFDSTSFSETSFVNCSFIDSSITHEQSKGDITNKILLVGGVDYENGFIEKYESYRETNAENKIQDDTRKLLLTKFFQVGSHRPRMKKMSYLINEYESFQRVRVSEELDILIGEGFLKNNGDNMFLTDEGITMATTLLDLK